MDNPFSFESHRNLIQKLGESDAVVEFTEVAVRSFIAHATGSGDFNSYLSNESKKFLIHVNEVDQKTFRQTISRGYIITITQNMEQFLKGLKADYYDLYDTTWAEKPEGTTLLDHTVNIVGKPKPDKFLISLFKYYSFVRNSHVHGNIKDEDKEYAGVKEHRTEIKARYKLDAPNHFNAISFDDFILFTRVSKELADSIAQNIYDKICHDYDSEKNDLAKYINNKQLVVVHPKHEKRGFNGLEGYMKTKFGLSGDYTKKLLSLCTSLA